jgi:dihydroorotate dehydrogenase
VSARVKDFKTKYPKSVLGINLGANKSSEDRVEDYCKGIETFSSTADYFVINISSPNTPNLRDLQKSESLKDLLERVISTRDSQARKVPIFLKVAPDLTESDIKSICSTVSSKRTKVDGLIVSNTTISRDNLTQDSKLRNESGGLSGKPLEQMSTELVRKFYKELKG